MTPEKSLEEFRTLHYLRHNQRRQEHLASLGLDLHGRTVLEVGAGIGDHTTFFLDRDCRVTSLEGRSENCVIFRRNMETAGYRGTPLPELIEADAADLRAAVGARRFEIVYCYGLLYHVSDPATLLAQMAEACGDLLLLETCVSYGDSPDVNPVREPADSPTQSIEGLGCRPTRSWIHGQLRAHFPHVYLPVTQPAHEEFPLDWRTPPAERLLTRAVFIASRRGPLRNPLLVEGLPERQRRV